LTAASGMRGGWGAETLAAARTLTMRDPQMFALDPDGSDRDVVLPTVTVSHNGYYMWLANAASAAKNLVVKNAAGSTIGTVNQSEMGIFYVDSDGDWVLFGIFGYSAT